MKHSYLAPLLLLLLTLSPSFSQICSLSTGGNDLLQSGTQTIANGFSNNINQRQHRFTFTVGFTVPATGLQVAASAASFSVSATNGMDFAIWGSRGTILNTGVIILLLNEDSTWNTVRVSYLASARSDFVLGSFSAGVYLLQQNSNNGQITYPHTIAGWSAQSNAFNVIVQISGVKVSSSSFSIVLSSVSINSATGMIRVDMSLSSTIPVENIVITYIAFSTASPIQFTQFSTAQTSSLPYQLIGMDAISSNGAPVYAGNGFSSIATQNGLTCIGQLCTSNCISSQNCVNNQGTILGSTCYRCASGQTPSNGQCITINNCGANQVRNSSGVCVCATGYTRYNNICYISCGTNAIIINSQCSCIPGYVFNSTLGQCSQPSNLNCQYPFIELNNQCVCANGLGLIGNYCYTCPANSFINANRSCQCVTGYDLNVNTRQCLVSCQANAQRNPTTGVCQCNNGYYLQNGNCVPQGQCTGGLVWNGASCVCPSPQVRDLFTNQCTYCNAVGRAITNNVCGCSSTYYPTVNSCLPCVANSQYNSTLGRCVCNSGYVLNNGQCVVSQNCPFGSTFNFTLNRCVCSAPDQYVIDGYCQNCQVNSTFNGTACVCNSGLVLRNGICQQECVNATWNGQTCVCWSGYYIIQGVCRQCDPNSQYSNIQLTCICNPGYFGTWQQCTLCNSTCQTCSGPTGNDCLTCSVGNPVNGACSNTCPARTFQNASGQCQNCTANCIQCLTATTCDTCQQGYTKTSVNNGGVITQSCILPSNTATHQMSLRGSVLGNNTIFQGVSFNALPATFIQGGCPSCDSIFNISVVSNFQGITTTQGLVTGTTYFFNIQFNYAGATFTPTFEFTIRINSNYATQFTSADNAQVLRGAYSSASFPTTPAALAASNSLSTGLNPPPTFSLNPNVQGLPTNSGPPVTVGNVTTSSTLNQDIINAMFN